MAVEIARYKAEIEALEPEAEPTIVEHPIDDILQTGESRLLGGGLSIHAPHRKTDNMVDT
jgi:hypothetical protein